MMLCSGAFYIKNMLIVSSAKLFLKHRFLFSIFIFINIVIKYKNLEIAIFEFSVSFDFLFIFRHKLLKIS